METADRIFGIIMIIGVIWLFVSIICEAVSSSYNRQRNEWLESRVRELEWENWSLKGLKHDLEWVKIDLKWERSRRESAERSSGAVQMLTDMTRKVDWDDEGRGGAAAQVAA